MSEREIPQVVAVTPASRFDAGAMDFLLRSCQRLDIPLTVIGESATPFTMLKKLTWFSSYLDTLADETIVVYTDAYDVFYCQGLAAIRDKFLALGAGILWSAEKWYSHQVAEDREHYDRAGGSRGYRYLNAGGCVGSAGSLRAFLAGAMEALRDPVFVNELTAKPLATSDQQLVGHYLATRGERHRVDLDRACEIFYVPVGDWDGVGGFVEVESGWPRLRVRETGSHPCVVHVPWKGKYGGVLSDLYRLCHGTGTPDAAAPPQPAAPPVEVRIWSPAPTGLPGAGCGRDGSGGEATVFFHHFVLLGLEVGVVANRPEIASAVRDLEPGCPGAPLASGALAIELLAAGDGTFAIRLRGRTVGVAADLPALTLSFQDLLEAEVRRRLPAYTALPAGAARIGGRRVLFPGGSPSDRTDVMVELLARGAEVLADRLVLVGEAGFAPFPRKIPMPREALERLPARPRRRLPPAADGGVGDVLHLDPADLGLPWDLAEGAPAAIFLLDPGAVTAGTEQGISGVEMVRRLLAIVPDLPARPAQTVRQLNNLVRGCECRVLAFADPREAAAAAFAWRTGPA